MSYQQIQNYDIPRYNTIIQNIEEIFVLSYWIINLYFEIAFGFSLEEGIKFREVKGEMTYPLEIVVDFSLEEGIKLCEVKGNMTYPLS